jgi:enterochelin esterase-like enzyme
VSSALAELLAAGPPSVESIGAFLAQNRFPLVDRGGVTFVFRGDVDAVNLRCWVSGLPTAQPLERIDGTNLWAHRMTLPPNSRIEYKFELLKGGVSELVVDPLNPVLASDPFGANSVCQGFGYERPGWTLPDRDARHGVLDELAVSSAVFGDRRRLLVYVPARFRRSRRYALLVAHDGEDYLKFAALQTVLDNLIDRLEIAPLIVALPQSSNRLQEYAGDERHARHVMEEMLPVLRQRYPLADTPATRGLMGASFGAVASLYTAWRYPGIFDRLVLQSGSFAFSDLGHHKRGPAFDPVVKFMNEFREQPGVPAQRMYLSCGIYESLIYENRSIVPLLTAQGIEVRFEEVRDAHNWENWRDRLRAALSFAFPGPLWMVYE